MEKLIVIRESGLYGDESILLENVKVFQSRIKGYDYNGHNVLGYRMVITITKKNQKVLSSMGYNNILYGGDDGRKTIVRVPHYIHKDNEPILDLLEKRTFLEKRAFKAMPEVRIYKDESDEYFTLKPYEVEIFDELYAKKLVVKTDMQIKFRNLLGNDYAVLMRAILFLKDKAFKEYSCKYDPSTRSLAT